MEKILFFLDYANINRAASENGIDLNYRDLLNYMSEGRFLIDAFCYVPIDPRNEHRLDKKINELWANGYFVNHKVGTIAGDTYKCNFDVEITIDILRIANTIKPDIVVIATGDVDLLPVVHELRNMGIRVEIACFPSAGSRKLLLQCSDFVDLSGFHNEDHSSTVSEIIMDEDDKELAITTEEVQTN